MFFIFETASKQKSAYGTISFQLFKEEILKEYHSEIKKLQLNSEQENAFLLQLHLVADMISNELLLSNSSKNDL